MRAVQRTLERAKAGAPMNYDPYANRLFTEFDLPFDDVDGLAAFLLSEENDAAAFVELRRKIKVIAAKTPPGSTVVWNTCADLLRILPMARGLFAGLNDSEQLKLAWRVLDRAVELERDRQ